ncbi:hypothetical protein BOTBODRAFT_153311 [Botryobasidium botryosum FD-172 SS1]|uniref:Uncharacterized protein n=1 Tax=Botryobasidium botryosum (strain FD-172 SS1) TaxID=930990 RepID=A0A067MXJ4_BOTB1|nr:hypothetical protein BOTBODRAFT_153311 [Botryobasidium botryosum FD-172 SS1]
MPITFTVAEHPANPIDTKDFTSTSPETLLRNACLHQSTQCAEMLQSSLPPPGRNSPTLLPSQNGFVATVVEAYVKHHHLVIRPDDVWIAILIQLHFYVNAHAEELRRVFVAHKGRGDLMIEDIDFAFLARRMGDLLHAILTDKSFHKWLLPDFTTTTLSDTTICAVIMMATLQQYDNHGFWGGCGIPTVTLEGEKSDWETIYERLDKLEELGDEPTAWAGMLRPILRRFVSAFDGSPDVDFWTKIDHHDGGSSPNHLSGWITAFCIWDEHGKWQGHPIGTPYPQPTSVRFCTDAERYSRPEPLLLDGVTYATIGLHQIPPGFCEVDVILDDNDEEFKCIMVAGHVATESVSTPSRRGKVPDTVRPSPHWFIFVKKEYKHPAARQLRLLGPGVWCTWPQRSPRIA